MTLSLLAFFISSSWAGSPATLEDVEGNTVRPPPAGIYVYSDRSGSEDASRAGAILRESGARGVVAIADVRGLGFWPLSTTVRDAVESQVRRDGAPILLDWTGAWGNMMGLQAGGCSVLIMSGESIERTSSCDAVISGGVKAE